jgi:hypothetical protein
VAGPLGIQAQDGGPLAGQLLPERLPDVVDEPLQDLGGVGEPEVADADGLKHRG